MISTGRTGQLAFFMTLFVLFIIRYRMTLKSMLLNLLVVVSIITVSYQTLPLFQKRADAAIYDIKKILNENYNSSFGLRAAWWRITYDAVKEEPLLGYGLGDYNYAAQKMVSLYNYKQLNKKSKEIVVSSHFHNQYLMLAVQGGLLALILMVMIFYKFIILDIKDKELKHLSIIGGSVLAISALAEPIWLLQFPLMLFIFMMGLFISASKDGTSTDIPSV
jgi:O-antigen ligase